MSTVGEWIRTTWGTHMEYDPIFKNKILLLQQHRIRGHYIKLSKPDTEKERPQFSLLCGN